ncbi:MAG: ATP-binding protein [Desulfomonile tiedjei]|uniref:Chromosomal replication initiator protein DnaA n=1 Tax=Desulfomonile tiedjei TaxID=2358 RepID=A0A9D6UYT7_9BACT|nr:ATP-binding protein [Desulfomonile tiedjei]
MSEKPRQPGPGSLPDFLKVCVQKGILDERSAQRIELYRRSRSFGKYQSTSAIINDPPDSGLTFDNYMVCKGNSFAVELAKTVANMSPSRLPYNPLYIYGDIGLGKTHLLSAIANAARDKKVLLINTADLETEHERAERLRSRAELREWLLSAEILLVDDIQLCEGREDVQRDLFSVLNHMTRAQRWVVISSDVPPTRLAGVESRLLSRLRGGVIVSLQMGDGNERRDLIRLFLDERSMPEDVVDYLADHITDDVRVLKAAVAQLLTLHEGPQTPLTIDIVQAVVPLPDGVPESTKAPESASPDHDTTGPQTPTNLDVRASQFEDMLAGVESKDRDASAMKLLKKMLAGAESKEEQSLALQIAVGERIRQLRNAKGDTKAIQQLEQALDLLREGRMEEAIRCISI